GRGGDVLDSQQISGTEGDTRQGHIGCGSQKAYMVMVATLDKTDNVQWWERDSNRQPSLHKARRLTNSSVELAM
ncbi:hypothetical protein KI387_015189, partial [Taxus chinensis]